MGLLQVKMGGTMCRISPYFPKKISSYCSKNKSEKNLEGVIKEETVKLFFG